MNYTAVKQGDGTSNFEPFTLAGPGVETVVYGRDSAGLWASLLEGAYQAGRASREREIEVAVKANTRLSKAVSMLRSAARCAGPLNTAETDRLIAAAEAVLEEEI